MDELFRAGIFDLESKSFKCSYHEVFSSEENLHPINPIHFSDQICTPSLIFNSPDNKVPKRLAGNTLTCNLAFAQAFSFRTLVELYHGTIVVPPGPLAMLLAVAHVNNKTDGIHDSLLSNTRINYIWKNTGRNIELATEAAMHFTKRSSFENDRVADGIIGPFNSGSAMKVQSLVKHIPIVQVSPSATSPLLSDDKTYPYFARTVQMTVTRSRHW